MEDKPVLGKPLVFLMAVASGATVANLYYSQPLLEELSRFFHVSHPTIAFSAMLIQAGYGLGLLFLVPLGDVRERRSLIITMLLLSIGALLLTSFSGGIGLFLASSLFLGVTSVVPQLLVPFAAQLALPQERGRAIGNVMSGLIIGILLSRTLSGVVGSALGWQAVYRLASLMLALLAVAFILFLPRSRPGATLGYFALIRSLRTLIRTQPVLREASVVSGAMFGAFSAFWTTLSFLLKAPPFNMGAQVAGLFGLVGVAGALAASTVGRITDRVSPRLTLSVAIVLSVLSYICFLVLGHSMAGLIAGVIGLDIGMQAAHISNQARIYALDADSRNRLNAVYMVSVFAGGAMGSMLGSFGWAMFAWVGVCAVGLGLIGIAAAVHAAGGRRRKKSAAGTL